jgi:hypothetical protein
MVRMGDVIATVIPFGVDAGRIQHPWGEATAHFDQSRFAMV